MVSESISEFFLEFNLYKSLKFYFFGKTSNYLVLFRYNKAFFWAKGKFNFFCLSNYSLRIHFYSRYKSFLCESLDSSPFSFVGEVKSFVFIFLNSFASISNISLFLFSSSLFLNSISSSSFIYC